MESNNISLKITVNVGASTRNVGFLDNFMTDVCNGLQAAHQGSPIGEGWDAETHPSKAIAILDDKDVISIDARKTKNDLDLWYSVELWGE